jgi:hypothetical protein
MYKGNDYVKICNSVKKRKENYNWKYFAGFISVRFNSRQNRPTVRV